MWATLGHHYVDVDYYSNPCHRLQTIRCPVHVGLTGLVLSSRIVPCIWTTLCLLLLLKLELSGQLMLETVFEWNGAGNWFTRLSTNWNCPGNWFWRLSFSWNCPDHWLCRLSIIGTVCAIDFGCCLLVGIVWTVGLDGCQLIEFVGIIEFRACLLNGTAGINSQSIAMGTYWWIIHPNV